MVEIQLSRGTVPAVRRTSEWRELDGRGWNKVIAAEPDDRATATRRNRFYNEWPFDAHRQIARWVTDNFQGKRGLQGDGLKSYEDESGYRLGSPRHFFEDVVRPALRYGDLFETEGTYAPFSLEGWREAAERLAAAVALFGENTDSDAMAKEFRWAASDEGPLVQDFVADNLPSPSGLPRRAGIRLTANSLLGWCWLNVFRDSWQEVTYKGCRAECGHVVPSLSMPTERFHQGRAVAFCGTACRGTARRNEQQNRVNELESRIAELEANDATN